MFVIPYRRKGFVLNKKQYCDMRFWEYWVIGLRSLEPTDRFFYSLGNLSGTSWEFRGTFAFDNQGVTKEFGNFVGKSTKKQANLGKTWNFYT